MKKLKFSGRDMILSFQHMFAMLGSTIIVPILAGMSIPMTLISAGLGTIIFYFVTKKRVPVFLGSSFAFLPALISLIGMNITEENPKFGYVWQTNSLAVMIALVCAGLVYVILAGVIKLVGVDKVKKLFPPIVVGPVIIIIGMILAPKMFWNNIIGYSEWNSIPAWKAWTTAIVTAGTIILINSFAKPKSFLKVIPILLGFIVGYIYSACVGLVSFAGKFSWDNIIIFQHIDKDLGFWGAWNHEGLGAQIGTALLAIVPIALVTFMEHLGDIAANSTVCGKDFMVDPGLHRTVLGDGLATMLGGMLGGPANTTYGENTAVLSITKNYDPKNILVAAIMAVIFGVFSVFSCLIETIPAPVIGGASIVLFGMISGNGLRALTDARVDFNNSKNMMVVATVLSVGLGLGAMSLAGDITGNQSLKIMIGSVEISPLAVATVLALVLNLIIPNRKEEEQDEPIVTLTSAAAVDMSDYNRGAKKTDETVVEYDVEGTDTLPQVGEEVEPQTESSPTAVDGSETDTDN